MHENRCPQCGATVIGNYHGTQLKCSNVDCGWQMGFDPSTAKPKPEEKPIETKPLSPDNPNTDTVTT